MSLCVQAFIHAHPHVFVLIQTRVYVFLNGIKTFEKNIVNPAGKTHCSKFNNETFLSFVHYSEWDIMLEPSELPDLLLTDGMTVRTVYRENHCPGLLLHISSIMRFPVSSEDWCHPLRPFKTHTRYSDVFLCCCQCVESEEPHTDVLHSAPHAHNPSPKSTYCKL